MPSGLSPEIQKAWRLLVSRLGSIDPADAELVEAAATMLARAREARAELSRQASAHRRGARELPHLMSETVRGQTANVLLTVERESIKEYRLLSELLARRIAARGASKRPKSLAEMRRSLKVAGDK